jgi:hypothetical protein
MASLPTKETLLIEIAQQHERTKLLQEDISRWVRELLDGYEELPKDSHEFTTSEKIYDICSSYSTAQLHTSNTI